MYIQCNIKVYKLEIRKLKILTNWQYSKKDDNRSKTFRVIIDDNKS